MDKVLAGGFSFIMLKNYILVKIASRYTDTYGQSLVYVSKDEFTVMSCYGWGVRSVIYVYTYEYGHSPSSEYLKNCNGALFQSLKLYVSQWMHCLLQDGGALLQPAPYTPLTP